jgi:DedD protein
LEQRIKERLSGAIILVAVVVLLVPALFKGAREPGAIARSTDPASPPLQSYTVDISTTSVPASPITDVVPAPAVVAPAASAPVLTSVPLSPQPSQPPQLIPSAAAAPVTPGSQKPVAAGWAVQLGSFNSRDNAQRMIRDGARKGLKFVVAGPDDRGFYRVRTAPQASRAAATEQQVKLRAKGYKGIIASVP